MQKITTFLWFDTNAMEAADFYCSVFKNSKINATTYYTEAGPMPKGTVLTVEFELDGEHFVAMNGGPGHPFTNAISLFVKCHNQAEVDDMWQKLLAGGGREVQCGWLTDKYGLSWQVVPAEFLEMLKDTQGGNTNRLMQTMMQMVKRDLKQLKDAYYGE